MANKAKHAFGSSERVLESIANGIIDSYDILFLDGDTDNPKIGWVDKDGNPVILKDEKADLSEVEAELATKITKKFEITSVPEGTLVDYRDKEIRVMCPINTSWTKQTVGGAGNPNMYYMGFKAYAPEGAVGFKEGDKGVIIDEYFDFNGDFAGTDELGRNYSICWLALASYDADSDTWTYFGKNSSEEKYIGWDYVVEWYDVNGVVIASDCVRINLSNEDCHSSTKPYYIGGMKKEIEVMVDKKIEELSPMCEIVEF